jgi:hypothetical protein
MKLSHWVKAIFAAIAAIGLPACDAISIQELKPGISTVADVRARLGVPTQEYRNPDGTTTLEFSRQPSGVDCYMVTIGPDQILQKIEQVLTEANLAKVAVGMDREEVRRLLGMPGAKTTYPNSNEEVWDWLVAGTINTERAHFHAHFDLTSGLVVRTSRLVEPGGR